MTTKRQDLGLSKEEVEFVQQNKSHSTALRVLQWFVSHGPATVYECELDLGAKTVSPRVNQLAAAGCLYTTGERRKTRGQSTAAVYAYREGSSFIAYLGLPPPEKRLRRVEQLSSIDRKMLDAARAFVEGSQRDPPAEKMRRLSEQLHHKLLLLAHPASSHSDQVATPEKVS